MPPKPFTAFPATEASPPNRIRTKALLLSASFTTSMLTTSPCFDASSRTSPRLSSIQSSSSRSSSVTRLCKSIEFSNPSSFVADSSSISKDAWRTFPPRTIPLSSLVAFSATCLSPLYVTFTPVPLTTISDTSPCRVQSSLMSSTLSCRHSLSSRSSSVRMFSSNTTIGDQAPPDVAMGCSLTEAYSCWPPRTTRHRLSAMFRASTKLQW
mmetsp:Transcript_5525/g.12112  ORF Transcript_5525/g.12112 Transcript_5525/m.12112 type:complete len:210 (+) Transcript_5525:1026-1655(+)